MSDLREALETAMSGKEVENVVSEEESTIDAPSSEENSGMLGDQKDGEDAGVELGDENAEAKAPESGEEDEKSTEKAEKNSDEPASAQKQGDAKQSASSDKPPVGWSPENREHWAKIPQSVRSQISKREQEVNKVLQDTATARRFTNDFSKTIEPYKAMMVAEGAKSPIHAVDNLLQTAATLAMGSKNQKAARIAQLINHYGIDIGELDNVLSGSQQTAQKPTDDIDSRVEQLVNQRLAPFQQQEQQRAQQQQQAVRQRAGEALKQVSNQEFFNDVRGEMADLFEMASRRGQTLTPVEAYRKAVQLNPEIQKVLRARQSQGLQQKKAAASSVSGKRGGVANNSGDQSLRDALEANWVASSRR